MAEQRKTFGWSFPICINKRTGKIETTEYETDIKQSILILLNTVEGERLMHKNYGSNLNRFMFEPISYALIKNIKDEIVRSIKKWETRIQNVTVDVFHSTEEETKLIIQIQYIVKETGEKHGFHYLYNLYEAK